MMIAVVYVDPGFIATLPEDYVKIARDCVRMVSLKLKRIQEELAPETPQTVEEEAEVLEEAIEDDLESFLAQQERPRTNPTHQSFIAKINQGLDLLEQMPRLKKTASGGFSVLEWWKKNSDLSIGNAAMTLSCLPSTQVSVERLFSGLAYILSEKRSRMSAEVLEAVLFLRMNGLE